MDRYRFHMETLAVVLSLVLEFTSRHRLVMREDLRGKSFPTYIRSVLLFNSAK